MRPVPTAIQELYLWRKGHGISLLLLLIAVGGSICLTTGSGAWVLAGDQHVFVGFSADSAYLIEQFPLLSEGRAALASAFAHHFFYPIVATLIVCRVLSLTCSERQLLLLRAKGCDVSYRYGRSLLASVMLSEIYSLGLSFFAFAVNAPMSFTDFSPFAMKLLFFAVLDASFTIVCFSACLVLNSQIGASILVLCAVYASLIIAMAHPTVFYPSHMSIWMHACGFGGPNYTVESLLFALASACASLVIARISVSFRFKYLS